MTVHIILTKRAQYLQLSILAIHLKILTLNRLFYELKFQSDTLTISFIGQGMDMCAKQANTWVVPIINAV